MAEGAVCRGGPAGGCSSPAAIGRHLPCDLRTCGQERGAARGLDGGGHAASASSEPGSAAGPRLPAGAPLEPVSWLSAGSGPADLPPQLYLGHQPRPRTLGSLGVLISEVRVPHGWWVVGQVHPDRPMLPGLGPCDSRRPRPGPSPGTLCLPRSASRGFAQGRSNSSGRGACPLTARCTAG